MSKPFIETEAAKIMMNIGLGALRPFHLTYLTLEQISKDPAGYTWFKYELRGLGLLEEEKKNDNWLKAAVKFVYEVDEYLDTHERFKDKSTVLELVKNQIEKNRPAPKTEFFKESMSTPDVDRRTSISSPEHSGFSFVVHKATT